MKTKKKNKTSVFKKILVCVVLVSMHLVGFSTVFISKINQTVAATLFTEDFSATTYKDSGNTTADWDTATGQADLPEGSTWANVGGGGFSAGTAFYTSLALDSSGVPYVAYVDVGNSSKATVMKLNGGGTGWEIVGVSPVSTGASSFMSLALDSSGVPYVAYVDVGNSSKATVMKLNGGGTGWEIVGVSPVSTGASSFMSLALDSSGVPYIAYQNGDDSDKAIVMKLNDDEDGWEVVGTAGFSADGAWHISLKLNSSDVSYVAYQDAGNSGRATVMKLNDDEDGWEVVGTAGFSADSATYISLAINSSGLPYVSYADGNILYKATVMKLNGAGDGWEVVGTAGFSASTADYTSLVINSSGVPYVAYRDFAKATVMNIGLTTPVIAQSLSIDDTTSNITKATLTPTATTPAGTSITYSMSVDGVPTWESATPGAELIFANEGSDLRWKADFATTDNTVTPTLTNLSISYTIASSGRRRDMYAPGDVTDVVVAPNIETEDIDNDVILTWVNPVDSDLAVVNIYRSDEEGVIPTESLVSLYDGETEYIDTDLLLDTTYYYSFETVDAMGNRNADGIQYAIILISDPAGENSNLESNGSEVEGLDNTDDDEVEEPQEPEKVCNYQDITFEDGDTEFANSLNGNMLLRTEVGGKIGYVDPISLSVFDITRENAICVFRALALGINEEDTNKIRMIGSLDPINGITNRLRGKLLLQVDNRGSIIYVDLDGYGHSTTWNNLKTVFGSVAQNITKANYDRLPFAYFGEM